MLFVVICYIIKYKRIFLQDKGTRQDCIAEKKLPSEQVIQEQVEKASSWWSEGGLQTDDDGLVPMSTMHSGGAGSAKPSEADTKGKRRSSSSRPLLSQQPLLAASNFRRKTAREFTQAEVVLKKAEQFATKILETVAPTVLPPGTTAETDQTLSLLRSRLKLVQLALDSTPETGPSYALYQLALKDPYLKDCESTLLASPDAVKTYGAILKERKVSLDLCL